MKKIFYGITLVLAVAMCFSLLFFPILKFDLDKVYSNHQEEIEKYITENENIDKSYEELKTEGINEIIYNTCIALQMYYSTNDVVFDEDGNMIESGNDNEAIMFDIVRLKNKGIKYTDLANSIKNQFDYNIKLNKAIKAYAGKMDMKMFFDNWANPFPMLIIVILIALEFACAVLVGIRSIKGILEKKKNKLFRISVFGIAISAELLLMPVIFKTNINASEVTNINDFVGIFVMNVKGTSVCYYCGIGFIISTALAILTKFLKY